MTLLHKKTDTIGRICLHLPTLTPTGVPALGPVLSSHPYLMSNETLRAHHWWPGTY